MSVMRRGNHRSSHMLRPFHRVAMGTKKSAGFPADMIISKALVSQNLPGIDERIVEPNFKVQMGAGGSTR